MADGRKRQGSGRASAQGRFHADCQGKSTHISRQSHREEVIEKPLARYMYMYMYIVIMLKSRSGGGRVVGERGRNSKTLSILEVLFAAYAMRSTSGSSTRLMAHIPRRVRGGPKPGPSPSP